jgi:hypothetical protein
MVGDPEFPPTQHASIRREAAFKRVLAVDGADGLEELDSRPLGLGDIGINRLSPERAS